MKINITILIAAYLSSYASNASVFTSTFTKSEGFGDWSVIRLCNEEKEFKDLASYHNAQDENAAISGLGHRKKNENTRYLNGYGTESYTYVYSSKEQCLSKLRKDCSKFNIKDKDCGV